MKRRIVAGAVLCASLTSSFAAYAEYPAVLDKGMKLDLGDPNRFIRIITWHQIWLRYDQHNPGSLVRGSVKDDGWDAGIRRSRFLIHGQMTKDLMIVFHAGINNQGTVGGGFGLGTDGPKKPQIFIHDAWGEYKIAGDWLAVGGGLHYWNGVSRMASASTLNFLAIDAPIFNWPTIDKTDQFARQLGVYAKGWLGNLEYRVAVNKPFATEGTPAEDRSDYDATSDTWAGQGYFKYDFFEKESNVLPYYVGSYLGKKKVWNVGAGFYWHPQSMAHLEGAETVKDDTLLVGLDTFGDIPMPGGAGLTFYGNVVYHDFGPNYVRNIGIMNPSTGLAEEGPRSVNGAGNAVPTVGTGVTGYAQAGFLLPDVLGRAGQIQPFAAVRYSHYEGLADPVIVPEAGLNWLIAGHHAKVTVQYRSRPVFTAQPEGKPRETERKSEVTMQLHFFY